MVSNNINYRLPPSGGFYEELYDQTEEKRWLKAAQFNVLTSRPRNALQ